MSTLQFVHSEQRLELWREGLATPLLTQVAAPGRRPFIHPILAPDGAGELTEDQPGHHLWQRGLYVGLNDVNGVGFWTEGLAGSPHDGSFHPRPVAAPDISGNHAAWEVVTDWKDPLETTLLTETQSWRLVDEREILLLDLEWTVFAHVDLLFGRYDYGGLFLRMPWRPETGGEVLTSEGFNSAAAAEAQPARWVALSMPIPGRVGPAGMAFFEHPSNPGYPAPWRVDGNLGIAPSRCIAGAWSLPAGGSSLSRYRLFVFTGVIESARVEAEWQKFAGA